MRRKPAHSADASQLDHERAESAFASQEETWRAIRDALELRQNYLQSKGIQDRRHVLNEKQRGELTKRARDDYGASPKQQELQ